MLKIMRTRRRTRRHRQWGRGRVPVGYVAPDRRQKLERGQRVTVAHALEVASDGTQTLHATATGTVHAKAEGREHAFDWIVIVDGGAAAVVSDAHVTPV
jgi:hypothetical protein